MAATTTPWPPTAARRRRRSGPPTTSTSPSCPTGTGSATSTPSPPTAPGSGASPPARAPTSTPAGGRPSRHPTRRGAPQRRVGEPLHPALGAAGRRSGSDDPRRDARRAGARRQKQAEHPRRQPAWRSSFRPRARKRPEPNSARPRRPRAPTPAPVRARAPGLPPVWPRIPPEDEAGVADSVAVAVRGGAAARARTGGDWAVAPVVAAADPPGDAAPADVAG